MSSHREETGGFFMSTCRQFDSTTYQMKYLKIFRNIGPSGTRVKRTAVKILVKELRKERAYIGYTFSVVFSSFKLVLVW